MAIFELSDELSDAAESFPLYDLDGLRVFYKLKQVNRITVIGNRYESTAEHTWSALMLADYFLTKCTFPIDRLKVYELLMYHDIVEIHAGDTPMHPHMSRHGKKEREQESAHRLMHEIPSELRDKYAALFAEYESNKTIEAQFAHAMDKLDAEITELDNKHNWKGWTEKFIRDHKQKYFENFPELQEFFEQLIRFEKENGYLDE